MSGDPTFSRRSGDFQRGERPRDTAAAATHVAGIFVHKQTNPIILLMLTACSPKIEAAQWHRNCVAVICHQPIRGT